MPLAITAGQRTSKKAVTCLHKGPGNFTAFSITHRWSLFLAVICGLCAARESKCSIARNTAQRCRAAPNRSNALQAPLVWAQSLQYLAAVVSVLKGWKDIQTFIPG